MTLPITQIGDDQREMTETEYAQWQTDNQGHAAKAEAQAAKDVARQAVLDKLGLTTDEAAALLG